jgi:hypothetical protein
MTSSAGSLPPDAALQPSARRPVSSRNDDRTKGNLAVIMDMHHDNTMVRTQISFDEELYARAQKEARRRGVSLAELCRRGLRLELAQADPARPWMRFVGSLSSGDPHASESVDDVVYGRKEP